METTPFAITLDIGSSRANHILSNWDEYLPKFRKVMPTEYRKALAKMEQAREAAQRVAAE